MLLRNPTRDDIGHLHGHPAVFAPVAAPAPPPPPASTPTYLQPKPAETIIVYQPAPEVNRPVPLPTPREPVAMRDAYVTEYRAGSEGVTTVTTSEVSTGANSGDAGLDITSKTVETQSAIPWGLIIALGVALLA